MKDKIIIIGAGESGKIAQALAEAMNVTVVTVEQDQTDFKDMPTSLITNNRIPDINDSVIANVTAFESGGLSKRAARRKAEREAKRKAKKRKRK